MSIMCGEKNFHDNTVLFFLENVVIPNYNQCFKLILTHKNRTASGHTRAQRLVSV